MPKYRFIIAISEHTLHTDQLRKWFSDQREFNTQDLSSFFQSMENEITESTINWRIRQLVEKGIISRIGYGRYNLGQKDLFKPYIKEEDQKLYQTLSKAFPYSDLCIWDTSIVNEFMVHQPFHYKRIVETDADSMMNVFYTAQEYSELVFLAKDWAMIDRYSSSNKQLTVVKPLVTEAPLQEIDEIRTVTIEKILVDLSCDTSLFQTFQGSELATIFEEVFAKYAVNQDKLLRYAQRRGKREYLQHYLEKLNLFIQKSS